MRVERVEFKRKGNGSISPGQGQSKLFAIITRPNQKGVHKGGFDRMVLAAAEHHSIIMLARVFWSQ